MIKSIQLHKLFGRFNYNISMKSGGVTIITGPNGFGKSTILRIAIKTHTISKFSQHSRYPNSIICKLDSPNKR